MDRATFHSPIRAAFAGRGKGRRSPSLVRTATEHLLDQVGDLDRESILVVELAMRIARLPAERRAELARRAGLR